MENEPRIKYFWLSNLPAKTKNLRTVRKKLEYDLNIGAVCIAYVPRSKDVFTLSFSTHAGVEKLEDGRYSVKSFSYKEGRKIASSRILCSKAKEYTATINLAQNHNDIEAQISSFFNKIVKKSSKKVDFYRLLSLSIPKFINVLHSENRSLTTIK